MFRHFFLLCAFCLVFFSPCAGNAEAQWTIMIYFDGTELGPENSACLMEQLRYIKASANVNVVVEMSQIPGVLGSPQGMHRIANKWCPDDGSFKIYKWQGVRRFHLDANSNFVQDEDRGDADLTNSMELQYFLTRTQQDFKALHYMLVIKNHGPEVPLIALNTHFFLPLELPQFSLLTAPKEALDSSPPPILTTSDPEYELYRLLSVNVEKAISNSFGQNKIDIVAFDSCYRSFLETAYDFRNVARYFVASEVDIITAERWHYQDWLDQVVRDPALQARDIAKLMVTSQEQRYPSSPHATVSSIDLSKIGDLAALFDQLATELKKAVPSSAQDLLNARPTAFAGANLDLLDYLQRVNGLPNASPTLQSLIQQFRISYIQNTSSYPEVRLNNAQRINGLAIYFPCKIGGKAELPVASYNHDDPKPIPFVNDHPAWSDYLRTLLAYPSIVLPQC
jgi:cysteine peptidase C11 family protein